MDDWFSFVYFQYLSESKILMEQSNDVYERLTHARRSAFEWHVSKCFCEPTHVSIFLICSRTLQTKGRYT